MHPLGSEHFGTQLKDNTLYVGTPFQGPIGTCQYAVPFVASACVDLACHWRIICLFMYFVCGSVESIQLSLGRLVLVDFLPGLLSASNKSIVGSQSIPSKCEYYTNADGIGCTNQKFGKEKC